jgi:hypothetical protein
MVTGAAATMFIVAVVEFPSSSITLRVVVPVPTAVNVVDGCGVAWVVTVAIPVSAVDHQYAPRPPVPTNSILVPTAKVAVAGDTETGAAATTVIVAVEAFPSASITLRVVVPTAMAVRVVEVSVVVWVVTVATLVSVVDHQYVPAPPVPTNIMLVPTDKVAVLGAIFIDAAGTTVIVAVPILPVLSTTFIVTIPVSTAVTVVEVVVVDCALTVATLVSPDDHQYAASPPVPTSVRSVPTVIVAELGATVIAEDTTVTVAVSVVPSVSVTVTVAVPAIVPEVKNPAESIVPTDGLSTLHTYVACPP